MKLSRRQSPRKRRTRQGLSRPQLRLNLTKRQPRTSLRRQRQAGGGGCSRALRLWDPSHGKGDIPLAIESVRSLQTRHVYTQISARRWSRCHISSRSSAALPCLCWTLRL